MLQFLRAVLRQDIGWYDTNTTSDFASKMTEDLNKIQDGIGEKMGMLVRFIVTFLGSLIYPYTQNWLISLVVREGLFSYIERHFNITHCIVLEELRVQDLKQNTDCMKPKHKISLHN